MSATYVVIGTLRRGKFKVEEVLDEQEQALVAEGVRRDQKYDMERICQDNRVHWTSRRDRPYRHDNLLETPAHVERLMRLARRRA